MDTAAKKREIALALENIQRRVQIQAAADYAVRAALWTLPVGIVLIAADARWQAGAAMAIAVLLMLAIAGSASAGAWKARRPPLDTARMLDRRAGLKSRVSTAFEFLAASLDGPREAQVHDAMAHLHAFDWQHHFAPRAPRGSRWIPALILAAAAALWIPPVGPPPPEADAGMDSLLRAAQAAELAAVREALEQRAGDDPEAEEVRRELERLAEELETGELDDRQAMIALSRMEAALASRMQDGALAGLTQEARDMAPPLQSTPSTAAAGEALAQRQPMQAAEALQQAARSARQEEMSEEERGEMAGALRMAAARLREQAGADGQPRAGEQSFAGDLEQASDAMDTGDMDALDEAMRQMAEKLGRVQQFENLEAMRQSMEDARYAMSMAEGEGSDGEGLDGSDGGEDSDRGGTEAGTGTDPNLFGDPQRLEESMRDLLAVQGQIGDGPMQSRIDAIEGSLSASQLDVRDIHAEYAAVAEEAIERETVPLSHRQHVRRYFEAIRPAAEQPEAAAP